MLTNNYNIQSLAHDDIVAVLAEQHNITLAESAEVIKQLSFKDYMHLLEASVDRANIPSPSGNAPIGTSSAQTITPSGPTAKAPIVPTASTTKSTYNPGDKVLVPNATGSNDESEVVSQDASKGTVTTRNAQTGQEQTHNLTDLLPAAKPGQPAPTKPGQPANPFPKTLAAAQSLMQSHSYEDKELSRILELAGLSEDASCGATSAGAIATVAAPLGGIVRRKQAEVAGNKTVQGKITPNAATGELSRRLADRGMKTASRKNNGKKIT